MSAGTYVFLMSDYLSIKWQATKEKEKHIRIKCAFIKPQNDHFVE